MYGTSLEDALTFLQAMPTAATALVLTSPPYGVAMPYEGGMHIMRNGHRRVEKDVRGRLPTNEEYVDNLRPILHEIVRILRPGGALGWQVGFRYGHPRRAMDFPIDLVTVPALLLIEDLGGRRLRFHQRIIWVKGQGRGFPTERRLRTTHETLSWFVKDGGGFTANIRAIPKEGTRWDGKAYTVGTDVWTIPTVDEKVRKALEGRECLMPLDLAKRFIALTTNKGDSVVDPFGGTATVAAAAALLYRQGYSCDRDHRAHRIAGARLVETDYGYTTYGAGCPFCGGTGWLKDEGGIGGRDLPCDCGSGGPREPMLRKRR